MLWGNTRARRLLTFLSLMANQSHHTMLEDLFLKDTEVVGQKLNYNGFFFLTSKVTAIKFL